jgi:hypothetical protein
MGRVLANSSGEELSQISGSGALNESYALYSAKDKMLKLIPDGQIATSRWDEFQAALAEDLADEEVLAWERRWKARNADKEMSWYVVESYFGGNVPQTGSPQHRIEEVHNSSLSSVLYRVPFLVE